jgi:hypothetical protein
VQPAYDEAMTRDLKRFFDEHATVAFENYPVGRLRDAPAAIAGERGGRR